MSNKKVNKKRISSLNRFNRLVRLSCLTILLYSNIIILPAFAQSEKVNIKANNKTIEQVLKQIENQTNYLFVYNESEIDLSKKVDVSVNNKSVSEILKKVLSTNNITYAMQGNNIMLMYNANHSNKSQTNNIIEVVGKITDSRGVSIIGASVIEKGTTNGAVTDVDGKFAFNVAKGAILEVSCIGYKTLEVVATSKLNLVLQEDTEALEEVVVVGYGTQKKANLTGAVSVVSSKDLKDVNASSVSQALQGKLSGVVITKSNGQPGAESQIRIRGLGTFGDNNPLIIVDGIPVSGLESISTTDIESVNVLKDAASAAIYGSRAANGVILVTTKRGEGSKSKISFEGYYGVQSIANHFDMCNAAEFVELQNESIDNANKWINGSNLKYYFDKDPKSYGEGTNWEKELYRIAPTYNVNLSASGGSKSTSYYISGSYLNQEGILINTSYDKINLRFNNDCNYGENLRFGSSINLNTSLKHGSSSVAGSAYSFSPTIPVIQEDGITPGYGKHSGETGLSPVFESSINNPETRNYQMFGNIYAEYQIFDWLKFKISGGLDYTSYESKSFTPTYNINNFHVNTRSNYKETRGKQITWLTDYILYFNHTINKHSIDGLGGFSQQLTTDDSIYGIAYDYVSEVSNMQVLDGGTNPEDSRNGGGKSQIAMMSWFGRFNYNYDDRYLFSFNLRADGSSRFAKKNRWGFFPSLSGAWRIDNEEFFHSDLISNLKLRINWGQLGNQSIANRYPTIATLSSRNVLMGPAVNHTIVPGYYISSLYNKDLKWETTTIANIGVDLAILNNRLAFSLEYFEKRTSDILRQQVVPATVGLHAPNINFAKTLNRGVEMEINWKDSIGSDFNYTLGANFSTVHNEVLKLSNNDDQESRIDGHRCGLINKVGHAIDSFYGLEQEGVYASQEDVDNSPKYDSAIVGSIKFKDQNNDGKIDANDRVILGNSIPKLSFGFRVSAEYKNFDFSMFMQGSLGKKQFMPYEKWINDGGVNYGKWWYDNRWKGEGKPGKWPAVIWGGAYSMYEMNDFLLTDVSYARLKNISLGYSFSAFNKTNFRVYTSLENVLTITNKDFYGTDPEKSGYAQYPYWSSSYPTAKIFIIGASIKF